MSPTPDPSPAPSDPGVAPSARAEARTSTSRAVLLYTGGRLVAFLVSLGVLRLLGFHTFALFLGAVVLSAVLSLLLLRRQRAAVSAALVARPRRDVLNRRARSRQGSGNADPSDVADTYDPYADDEDLSDDDADPYADGPSARGGRTVPPGR